MSWIGKYSEQEDAIVKLDEETLKREATKQFPKIQNAEFICWVGPGWRPLIWNAYKRISRLLQYSNGKFTVTQIKEKFGTLRFYSETAIDDKILSGIIDLITDEAETQSCYHCETCGSIIHVTTSGSWLKTYCEACCKKGSLK